MWLVFMLAALVMLVSGIAGSVVVKSNPDMVPEWIFPHLPLAENIAYSAGIGLALLGVALCYRKLGRIARIRGGSATGRLRRLSGDRHGTRPVERPSREATEEGEAGAGIERKESERETIPDAVSGDRAAPGSGRPAGPTGKSTTRRLRRSGGGRAP